MAAPRIQSLEGLAFPGKGTGTAARAPAAATAAKRVAAAVPAVAAATSSAATKPLAVLFYVSIALFVLFLVLLAVHFFVRPIFSFGGAGAGSTTLSLPVPTDRQVAFKDKPAPVDTKTDFTEILACSYTVSFDLFVEGDFKSTTAPRILLYRAETPATVPPTLSSAFEPSQLRTFAPTSNLFVYLDPTKNDLYVAVATQATNMDPTIQISKPITNVPIRRPFRISLVIDTRFVEIYSNTRLVETLVLTNPPMANTAPFMSPIALTDQSVRLATLTYWPRILRPNEIRSEGGPVSTPFFA